MPTINDFTDDPIGFCSQYSVLVIDPPGLLEPGLAINADHDIGPRLMAFGMSPYPASPNTMLFQVTAPPAGPDQVGCYFLPYKPDAAVTMTIGGGADYFLTSMLTGCTVRVYGPAATPTITHSNAASTFNATVGDLAASQAAAQVQIEKNMEPLPGGVIGTSVTAVTMRNALTDANLAAAKASYPADGGFRVKELTPKMINSKGTDRAELGMFVYGMRGAGGDWEFYYAASTAVTGRQKTGKTYFGFINSGVTNKTIDDGVVLGGTPRFWP